MKLKACLLDTSTVNVTLTTPHEGSTIKGKVNVVWIEGKATFVPRTWWHRYSHTLINHSFPAAVIRTSQLDGEVFVTQFRAQLQCSPQGICVFTLWLSGGKVPKHDGYVTEGGKKYPRNSEVSCGLLSTNPVQLKMRGGKPLSLKQYLLSWEARESIRQIIEDFFPCVSPCNSPVLLIKKNPKLSSGGRSLYRFVQDSSSWYFNNYKHDTD